VTIFVQFDRPAVEEVRLWVQANGRNDFNVTPDTLALGQVKRGGTPAATAAVTFYGLGDVKITDVKSESNYIQATVKEVRRQDTEVAYQVTAKMRGDTPVGKWYTDLWVKTNNAALPQIRVPLTVEIESPLSVSPDAVALGEVKVQAEGERRVIVRGVKPFRITKVQGTDDELSVRDSIVESKPIHVLTVKLKPAKPGELNRTVRIVTDLPEDGEIDLHVSAQVMP
jgi:hypothetical protein